jgi:uncharacterized protein (TIGR02246 family)
MSHEPPASEPSSATAEVSALYHRILHAWNARDAEAYASLFAEESTAIGFDGSQMTGRAEIAATLRGIFSDHQTGRYVGSVRAVTILAPEVVLLRAVAGIVPAGHADLNPALNALQTLLAAKRNGDWRIILYQNTPAQFHGRPDAIQQLTDELRRLL